MADPITVGRQRKYKTSASITTATTGTTNPYQIDLDGFTPPDRMGDAVTRKNPKWGVTNLVGPLSYGDMTLKFTLKIAAAGTPNIYAQLIADLESLVDSDQDTCNVSLYLKNKIATEDETSYQYDYYRCRVRGLKIDDLDSRGDDDLVHITITLLPGAVSRTMGKQITG